MKYPLKADKTGKFFPEHGNCGTCGNPTNEDFVCLSINISEKMNDMASPVFAEVTTSVSLAPHGEIGVDEGFTLFDDTNDAFFCSTTCLRAFLNQVVTDFESGVR